MNFTAGPWTYEFNDFESDYPIADPNSDSVALAFTEENAKLISQAPELYSAIKLAHRQLSEGWAEMALDTLALFLSAQDLQETHVSLDDIDPS